MPTLNTSKWAAAYIRQQSTHSAARDGTTASLVTVNPTGSGTGVVRYARIAGRGGTTYETYRMFYYFDTSGITGTVTAAKLNIQGYFSGGADFIVVPSDAFAADGSADMVTTEYGNISFNTNYGSEITSWSTSAINAITLAPTALSDMESNDYFICAVIENDYDYKDTDPGAGLSVGNGVDYANPLAYLDYTVGTGYGNTVAGVASASISKVCGVETSGISKVLGV